jgi:hypothetical protein
MPHYVDPVTCLRPKSVREVSDTDKEADKESCTLLIARVFP